MRSTKILVAVGIVAVVFTAILAGRLIWEETALTIQQGPQMVGFSLAHGMGGLLFFAPLVLAIWLLTALAVLVWSISHKLTLSQSYWLTLAGAVVIFGTLSMPEALWQWTFIDSFAKSPHASDLMVRAAVRGDVRVVRGYLAHGVPLTATNYEGATAAYAAAMGGSLPLIEMLADKGADLNALNWYGDSPLEVASKNGHTSVADFLRAHGALQVQGTPAQRLAASQAIVRKQMDRDRTR